MLIREVTSYLNACGTDYSPVCRNRAASASSTTSTFGTSATLTDSSTLIVDKAISGGVPVDEIMVLDGGDIYLFEIVNKSGAEASASITIDFIEE